MLTTFSDSCMNTEHIPPWREPQSQCGPLLARYPSPTFNGSVLSALCHGSRGMLNAKANIHQCHVTVTVTLLMTPICPMRSMKESLTRTRMSVVTQSLLPCSMLEPGV